MSVQAMRAAFRFFVATVGIGLLCVGGLVMVVYRYPDRPHHGPAHAVSVTIDKGSNLQQIAQRLATAGVVDSATRFRLYASWRGLAHRVKAGRYDLRQDMTPREVLSRLIEGVAEPEVIVTIPEGKHMLEVADLLARAGVGTHAEIMRLMRDAAFVRSLGVQAPTVEGYLFPDTYRLRPNTPKLALRSMTARFREVMTGLQREYPQRVEALRRELGFGEPEIVTMASIVEKETGRESERPLVASAYLNRLRLPTFQPKLLEADPTIVYGCIATEKPSDACQRFRDRIRTAQLRDRDNLYNTYVHPGLPPGPIANPGRASLQAVLQPADTTFLYFVSRNDGTHQFSTTLLEHRAAVQKYQRGGSGSANGPSQATP
jgi:peptidoglycan lytic transglycosylase G